MAYAIAAKTILIAAKPVAVQAAKVVGFAVGYGAFVGVTVCSMRASVIIADKVVDKLDNKLNDTNRKQKARIRDLERANSLLNRRLRTSEAELAGDKEYGSWIPQPPQPEQAATAA